MTDKEFLSLIKDAVIMDMHNTGILASLTAAQAFIESNKGSSQLAKAPNNNLFGIKGSYNGQSVTMKTKEYVNGAYVVVNAAFRKYPSWAESIADHSAMFIRLKSRYGNLIGEKNYKEACRKVQADGYATAPAYADTLIRTIEKYNLQEWDKADEPVDLDLVQAINVIADRVIDGKFGYGHDQRASQIYAMVRARVNEILY